MLASPIIVKVRESKDISSYFIVELDIFVPNTDPYGAGSLWNCFHFKINIFVPYWFHTCTLNWFCLLFGKSLEINLGVWVNLGKEISIPDNFSSNNMKLDSSRLENSSSFVKICQLGLKIDRPHWFIIVRDLLRLHRLFVSINKLFERNNCRLTNKVAWHAVFFVHNKLDGVAWCGNRAWYFSSVI